MMIRYAQSGVRAFAAAAAAIWSLGLAGCGETSAPEIPAKSAAPPAPIAGTATNSRKAEPLRVDPAAAADAALVAAVKAALAADPRLKSFAIDIRASNGAVELFGTVDAKSSQTKAEKIAAAVEGVKSVKNHLVVVSGS